MLLNLVALLLSFFGTPAIYVHHSVVSETEVAVWAKITDDTDHFQVLYSSIKGATFSATENTPFGGTVEATSGLGWTITGKCLEPDGWQLMGTIELPSCDTLDPVFPGGVLCDKSFVTVSVSSVDTCS